VLSITDSEVLHLHYIDLKRMEGEYLQEYQELFNHAKDRLIKVLAGRIQCLKEEIKKNDQS
jgi:hypothetical protein